MQTHDSLKKAFNKVEDENWNFRFFLKGEEPEDLDKLVNELHNILFKKIDCKSCQNCCKTIAPAFTNKDISRASKRLGITFEDFRNKHLIEHEGEWIINSKPCSFLTKNGCLIYESRPNACKGYPYTHEKEIVCRLYNLIENCEICPVVFEIIERLKIIYKKEFNEYKEEMKKIRR